ncbi:MAG: hypothetical protein KC708_14335 [Anaerolineae bacterium]|nr:hypothetical protein [Anaerolineae bacterium]
MAETTMNSSQQSASQRHVSRIPGIGSFHLPLNRNDLLLLLVAFTEIGMGVETALAHLISGSIKPGEAIPVVFGPLAGIALIVALAMRVRAHKATLPSSMLVILTGMASVGVGLIGSAFHWSRVLPPTNFANYGLQWDWIIYAPPVVGPLAFTGVGLLAIIALLEDTRPETGKLTLPGIITFNTPLPQTRQFLWLIALGLYAATLSAMLDHARTGFESIFVWIPLVLGVFGSVTTTLMAIYHKHTSSDYFIYFWVMLLMIGVGVIGLGLHINADLPEGVAGLQIERFIRGAPVMAPMLFAIMGSFGLITMIDAPVDDGVEAS